ncbi:uncharacterized protein BDV17DRAFT_290745 [Aspergillus undulatus]|uniref:uncharacterized protein n=1 Tax=Aspergillus undulatus TaxID=1810928 RepID=UPI003CCDD9A6
MDDTVIDSIEDDPESESESIQRDRGSMTCEDGFIELCPKHPPEFIFADSRRSPPPLPSQARILRDLMRTYSHRDEYKPSSSDTSSPYRPSFLPEFHDVKTVRAISRRSYIKLSLSMDPEQRRALRDLVTKAFHGTVDVLVDLFDDQRLVEMCSLLNDPELFKSKRVSFEFERINCERQAWHRSTKALVERFWLCLFAEELDDSENC